MFRLGRHEKPTLRKIADSRVWDCMFLAAILTMPVWMPLFGIV